MVVKSSVTALSLQPSGREGRREGRGAARPTPAPLQGLAQLAIRAHCQLRAVGTGGRGRRKRCAPARAPLVRVVLSRRGCTGADPDSDSMHPLQRLETGAQSTHSATIDRRKGGRRRLRGAHTCMPPSHHEC